MTQFKRESELLAPVARYLRRIGFSIQRQEFQFYDYSIDLCAYSKRKKIVTAVELKLINWKRAYEQALIYQLCSDLVFIALPASTVKKVDLELLQNEGIGLIAVYSSGRCRRILSPLPSKVIRKGYKESSRRRFEGIRHA